MTSQAVLVQRRLPTFDVVIPTSLSLSEASARLSEFLTHQRRPQGFVLADPTVDGSVSGQSFEFRRREAMLTSLAAPVVRGHFVPSQNGTIVYARVQLPTWWWVFELVASAGFLFTWGLSVSLESVGVVALLVAIITLTTVGPLWVEGAQAAKLLQTVLVKAAV